MQRGHEFPSAFQNGQTMVIIVVKQLTSTQNTLIAKTYTCFNANGFLSRLV